MREREVTEREILGVTVKPRFFRGQSYYCGFSRCLFLSKLSLDQVVDTLESDF